MAILDEMAVLGVQPGEHKTGDEKHFCGPLEIKTKEQREQGAG